MFSCHFHVTCVGLPPQCWLILLTSVCSWLPLTRATCFATQSYYSMTHLDHSFDTVYWQLQKTNCPFLTWGFSNKQQQSYFSASHFILIRWLQSDRWHLREEFLFSTTLLDWWWPVSIIHHHKRVDLTLMLKIKRGNRAKKAAQHPNCKSVVLL